MHTYLPSIGFSGINSWTDEERLLKWIVDSPDQVKMAQTGSGNRSLAVYEKHFSEDGRIGIRVFGTFENGHFSVISYLPYAENPKVNLTMPCELTRAGDGERLIGSVDDFRLGLLLIFTVSNYGRILLAENQQNKTPEVKGIRLTGLGKDGRIIMPVKMTEAQKRIHQRALKKRDDLSKRVRAGDQDAVNEFCQDDVSLSSDARLRLLSGETDVYSVVNTTILPVGVECDQYQVVALILSVETIRNDYTKEELYYFRVRINTVEAVICIPKSEVYGVPEAGRRLKCKIWLIGEAVTE